MDGPVQSEHPVKHASQVYPLKKYPGKHPEHLFGVILSHVQPALSHLVQLDPLK